MWSVNEGWDWNHSTSLRLAGFQSKKALARGLSSWVSGFRDPFFFLFLAPPPLVCSPALQVFFSLTFFIVHPILSSSPPPPTAPILLDFFLKAATGGTQCLMRPGKKPFFLFLHETEPSLFYFSFLLKFLLCLCLSHFFLFKPVWELMYENDSHFD